MRDEQEQSIKEKASPPREDPRIDVLIGAYRNLAVKVDLLQEQIQEQEKELTRQKDSTVDAILTELHQEKEQGAFPSTGGRWRPCGSSSEKGTKKPAPETPVHR